jgi:hypothetical protein
MYILKFKVLLVTALLLLGTPLAFGLAVSPPSIFLLVSPKIQDTTAGDSIEFELSVLPQGEWENGEVSFELKDPPEGVTAMFVPDTWVFADDAPVIMTVEIAEEISQGNMMLKVVASGRECCYEGEGRDVNSESEIELNIVTQITKTATPNQTTTTTPNQTTTTPNNAPLTTIEQPIQVMDFIYPVAALGVILALLFGVILMRKKFMK